MKNECIRERPFEFLRDRNGNSFSEQTVKNWYISRAYVLDKLKGVTYAPREEGHLQVIIDGDSPLMLSVVRSVALYAHYLNFEEEDLYGNYVARNRTVITLVSQQENIDHELRKEEYLCNLMDCCRWSKFGSEVHNSNSFLDIELQIVKVAEWQNNATTILITKSDIDTFINSKEEKDIYTIDTRKAILVDRIYELGSLIDNLPAENIHSAKRYSLALDIFQYDLLREKMQPLINQAKWKSDVRKVKNGISSIFCADCFESRALAMRDCNGWEVYNMELSVSEHARWVTERLIMGYRPLYDSEKFQYECLFGKNRSQYFKTLKNNILDQTHIDICSFRNLRRINPDDMKYDSFLLLAIPRILRVVK